MEENHTKNELLTRLTNAIKQEIQNKISLDNTVVPQIDFMFSMINEALGEGITIEEKINAINEYFQDKKLGLCDQKEAMKFLGIKSRQTMHNYIHNGTFIKDKHYREENGKTVYIPEGLIEFKKTYVKHKKSKSYKKIIRNNFMNSIMAA